MTLMFNARFARSTGMTQVSATSVIVTLDQTHPGLGPLTSPLHLPLLLGPDKHLFARDNSVYFEFHPTLRFCSTYGLYTFILSIPPMAATSRLTPCELVEVQFGTKLQGVQTDDGGEFQTLTPYFAKYGIVHRFPCPYTHYHNDSIELKHRYMVEIGLTLLAQADLLLTFWNHAFLTTTQ
ncbi:hypothetical protein CR513_00011, partial [Mucuna pruriens]